MLSIEKQNAIIGLRDDEPFGQVRQRREALDRVLRTLASKPSGPVEENGPAGTGARAGQVATRRGTAPR